jgi:hypothetical protein
MKIQAISLASTLHQSYARPPHPCAIFIDEEAGCIGENLDRNLPEISCPSAFFKERSRRTRRIGSIESWFARRQPPVLNTQLNS